MNVKQKKRLTLFCGLVLVLSVAMGLVLYALKQNINLFYTPTEAKHATIKTGQVIRLGGYVKLHSVHYDATGKTVHFVITDRQMEIPVMYTGVLPNLFREGQTVVVTGSLDANQSLVAAQVLAKHDEKYMPKSLEKALKK